MCIQKVTDYELFDYYYKLSGYIATEDKFNKSKLKNLFNKTATFYNVLNTTIPAIYYIDYLINNKIKYYDWSNDRTFDNFLDIYTKNETIQNGLSRTNNFLNSNNVSFDNLSFSYIINNINNGNISPWYMFIHQSSYIATVIDSIRNQNLLNIVFWNYKINELITSLKRK